MQNSLLAFFLHDFGTKATVLMAVVFFSTLPFCIYRRKWPDIGCLLMMLIGIAGTLAGIRISALTICLPIAQLGALADDKPTLFIGGLVTFVIALRDAITHWRAITQI
jgi:hypothetical protein